MEADMENTNWILKSFAEGGLAMYFIAAIGVMVVVLIIERIINMRNLTLQTADVDANLFAKLVSGKIKDALAYCDSVSTPLTNTLKSGLVQVLNRRSDEEVQVAMDAQVLEEAPRLEGWTGLLAVLANVATLIGLLGTILGLIRSFGAISNMDAAQKATQLSAGIAEALHCTAFGLMVAIPALIAYAIFQIRVERATGQMLKYSMNLMNVVVANREKLKDI
jgi:biopolymer transport protein ExbB